MAGAAAGHRSWNESTLAPKQDTACNELEAHVTTGAAAHAAASSTAPSASGEGAAAAAAASTTTTAPVPASAEARRTSPEAWTPPPRLLAAPPSASRSRFARTVSLVWPLAGSECGGVRGDARDVHGRCARTLGCACMRRSSLHAASFPWLVAPARTCCRALMHPSPALAGTLQRCCTCFPCADSRRFVALATCRQRPKASAAGTQAYQVASSRSGIGLGRSAHVRTAADPAQRAVGHRPLRSNRAQSKAETRSIRDPTGYSEHGPGWAVWVLASGFKCTEESWLLRARTWLGCFGPHEWVQVHRGIMQFCLSMPSRPVAPDCPVPLGSRWYAFVVVPMHLGVPLSTPSTPEYPRVPRVPLSTPISSRVRAGVRMGSPPSLARTDSSLCYRPIPTSPSAPPPVGVTHERS